MRIVVRIGLMVVLGGSAHATSALGQAELLRADSLYRAEDWQGAVVAYDAITLRGNAGGQMWFRLGFALKKLGEYMRSARAFEVADSLGFARPTARYNAAAAFALAGDVERAFQWLGGALDLGFRSVDALQSDEELASLRDDPRFAVVVDRADRQARPCAYDDRYNEFDFWLGQWEVYTSQGQRAGSNTIQKIENGCLVTESWTAATGGTGKSINFYDPASGKWNQVWVDGTGGIIVVNGEFREGAMRLEGTHTYADEHVELYRMVFTPRDDGSVRQLIEQSQDSGATWYVWFDGIYVKRDAEQDGGR